MTPRQRLVIHDQTAPGRLTPALIERLLADLAAKTEAAVVTLEGRNGVFCEGFDLTVLAGSDTSEQGTVRLERFGALLDAIAATPRPVIALVDGPALAGGVGLAAAADLVIATPRASFALPETLFGLVPAMVFPVLASRIGAPRARWLALGGAPLTASEAWRLGLVDDLADDLEDALGRHERRLSRLDPRAVAAVKAMARVHDATPERYRAHAVASFHDLRISDETRERIQRFIAGDTPWPETPVP